MIKTVLKYFAIITFSSGLIWGVSKYFANNENDMSGTKTDMKQINVKIDSLTVMLRVLPSIQTSIVDLQTGQKTLQSGQTKLINGVAAIMIKNKSTSEEMFDFMRQFQLDIKKNMMINYIQIPYRENLTLKSK